MTDANENQGSNPEGGQDTKPEDGSKTVEELTKELADAKTYGENQKIRAEKAEKSKAKKTEKTKTPKKTEKSDEPDSIRIAYEALLNTLGYKHPDDKKYIFDEAEKLKMSPADVVKMEHAKLQLKTSKAQREAEGGMPEGGGKKGGGTKSSVDYWVNKTNKDGGYENPPNDPALTIKVVNTRMEKERNKQEFPDS